MVERVCQRWLVAGRVQGVGYRAWMVKRAGSLGVVGWVRNLPDGRVEAVVRAEPGVLATLLQACRRGPRLASVATITVDPDGSPPPPQGTGFRQADDAS